MKRMLFHSVKKSHKPKDRGQTTRQATENGEDEDIEPDNASEVRSLSFRNKGLQNGAAPSLEKVSSQSVQSGMEASGETRECVLRCHMKDKSYNANRDSGISSVSNSSASSNISATSTISATSKLSITSNISAVTNISATTNILATNNTSSDETSDRCLQSDLHTKYHSCLKHPQHEHFIPIFQLSINHMPEHFQNSSWVKLIKLKSVDVVRLMVAQTSNARPDELGFKGSTTVRFGTGTAFVHNMEQTELCGCDAGHPGHLCSGAFLVMTASHVVFDDYEARATAVDFFYDSMDVSTIVRAWGVRVVSVDVERNRSVVECRTHDLNLCHTLKKAQNERNQIIKNELEPTVGSSQMAVLISHPHGLCKQVSFGNLKVKNLVGAVKITKDGIQLADCLLTYDTPTCPGSGGGPVNVMGGGTASYAFAPHCASKDTDENLSGLGWARVI